MASTPEYFNSPEIITLIIGQECKKLHVPRSILEQIPFFSNGLKGDRFKEAREKVFEMPEDDPKAVNDLLHFVFADHIKPIMIAHEGASTQEEVEVVLAYLRAFIIADKYMAERTANRILDRLYEYHEVYTVDFDQISMLSSVGLQESPLYDFLIDETTEELKTVVKDKEAFRPGVWDIEDNCRIFDFLRKDDAAELLNRLAFARVSKVNWKKCDIHTHESTPTCSDKSLGVPIID